MPTPQSTTIDVRHYWGVVWRRKAIVLLVLLLAIALGIAYAYTVTPVYRATAQVIVDTETVASVSFAGGTGQYRDPNEYFNTQKEILASRPFLDLLSRRLKLDQNPAVLEIKRRREEDRHSGKGMVARFLSRLFGARSADAPPAATDAVSATELDPFSIDLLHGMLSGAVGRARNIMKISCVGTDPALVAAIASGAAQALVEYNLSLRLRPYQNTADWLASQIVESKKKVETMEQKMQGYREVKGDQTVLAQQLQQLFSQLNETETAKLEARDRLARIQAALGAPDTLGDNPDILANPVALGLRTEERSLSRQLSELSERYGPQHPQIIRTTAEIEKVRAGIVKEARKMLVTAKAQLATAESRSAELARSLEQKKNEIQEISRMDVPYNMLGGEAGNSKSFYEMLIRKMEEMSLTISSATNISVLQVLELATPPTTPIRPRRGMILQFSVLAGLFGGLLLAFVVETLDNTIKTVDDVEKHLKVPYLDLVPLVSEKKGSLFVVSDPRSAIAESFRTIRTGLLLSSVDKPPKVILVTSSVPNEGKTTVSANLAVSFAQMGERVLVIDADLRRHNIHELFELEVEHGLSDVLRRPETLSSAIKKPALFPNVCVLTGGTVVPNPSEMLSSARMKQLVTVAAATYDRIILDAPPLRMFSDALVLSQLVDGVIVVVWGGSTPRPLVQQSLEALQGVRANILGVVLSKVNVSRGGGYYYHYYRQGDYAGYYAKKTKSRKKKKS